MNNICNTFSRMLCCKSPVTDETPNQIKNSQSSQDDNMLDSNLMEPIPVIPMPERKALIVAKDSNAIFFLPKEVFCYIMQNINTIDSLISIGITCRQAQQIVPQASGFTFVISPCHLKSKIGQALIQKGLNHELVLSPRDYKYFIQLNLKPEDYPTTKTIHTLKLNKTDHQQETEIFTFLRNHNDGFFIKNFQAGNTGCLVHELNKYPPEKKAIIIGYGSDCKLQGPSYDSCSLGCNMQPWRFNPN